MIKQLLRKWLKEEPKEPEVKEHALGAFSTDASYRKPEGKRAALLGEAYEKTFQVVPEFKNSITGKSVAMDAGLPNAIGTKQQFIDRSNIPVAQVYWYAAQSFIGYQLCAMIAQHWLVAKCCAMPARDAVRKWFEITINDGTEVDAESIAELHKADIRYKLKDNLIRFVQKGRIFGIRIAIFKVRTNNPDEYYGNPFNIDAVEPGSYEGIAQVDPYWCTPVPDDITTSDPGAIDFYEPTWWQIQGRKYHRSHLMIFRTEELPDTLKPSYQYGSVSIPQKVYERVYAAERTANEAPMLALTKRTTVIKTDLAAAQADMNKFIAKTLEFTEHWNNYGIKNIGHEDELSQLDTTLSDLDSVIMSQYQLVAAIANVPAVKLLGTSPKGFNATGEFEEANYHEELESVQSQHLTAFVNRHHELVIKSDIAPDAPFETSVMWNSLDAMTGKEVAELNKLKADTDAILSGAGAIDGQDIRNRLIADGESGYNGLTPLAPEPDDIGDDEIHPNDSDDDMGEKDNASDDE